MQSITPSPTFLYILASGYTHLIGHYTFSRAADSLDLKGRGFIKVHGDVPNIDAFACGAVPALEDAG